MSSLGFASPVAELVARRRSCRRYLEEPIPEEARRALATLLEGSRRGPFGGRARFRLVAADARGRDALRGLGTYGFIRGAPGFVVGAIERGPRDLEDYGWLLERAVLRATDLGLGSCWLGGTFSKSGFARKIALAPGETLPAVAAVGLPVAGSVERDRIRRIAGSDRRRPAGELFFEGRLGAPLREAGPYAGALEALRRAPSASNKQPWRVVRTAAGWHFYLARTPGYGKGTLAFALLRMADLQRVDLGIAMCHFELAAREGGLRGSWTVEDPGAAPAAAAEYTATWRAMP